MKRQTAPFGPNTQELFLLPITLAKYSEWPEILQQRITIFSLSSSGRSPSDNIDLSRALLKLVDIFGKPHLLRVPLQNTS